MKGRGRKLLFLGGALLIAAVGIVVLFPRSRTVRYELRSTMTESVGHQLEQALEIYRSEHGHFPDETVPLEQSVAPYFRGSALDEWGHPYRFVVVDGHAKVSSAGPDGLFDTTDDVPAASPRSVARPL